MVTLSKSRHPCLLTLLAPPLLDEFSYPHTSGSYLVLPWGAVHAPNFSQLNASGAVRDMQDVIGRNAHQLVYGGDGHYRDDDAVGSLLQGLMAEMGKRASALSTAT